ncbi:uncharacterized protein F4812DRAFT_280356 [Daldinia caldariorum]|uniref:uncharacterized protein n=1 Tax=Daldinia caldariorum TaxID=326644 RepID=UPI0020084A62|nr:uncharacterized protein F4812DRAFT_280356 [Daldinia caldariorum]KAI1470824.1 hypothetical protein F4812DRAFT_280356 [Daldinia caldariorum]
MNSDGNPEYRAANSGSDGEPSRPPPASSPGSGESARKRRHHRTVEPSSPAASSLPKRQKGASFNFQYLGLLNEEIGDAAAGTISRDDEPSSDLPPSQVGVVSWSPSEKHALFSALDRLGRDDIAGIAARVGTKSPLEVRQYLVLLGEAERARREDDGKRRRALRPVDVPAAAELSTELCAALEQAADVIAARCERYEAVLEQKRWQGRWLITAQLARVLERQQRTAATSNNPTTTTTTTRIDANVLPPFAELFALRNWLQLSERVFMNSSVVPDGNWRGVSSESSESEAPSIRATALADFHSLVVSVTRRLVGATLYVAGSRVRAKRAGDRRSNRTSGLVKIRDVQAAVASVGMPENSREFWARAARRLRLDVYDDEQDDDDDDDENGDDRSEDGSGETDQEYGSGKEGEDREDFDVEAEDTMTQSDVTEEEEEEERHNSPIEIHDDETDSPPPLMSYDEVETALGFPRLPRPSSPHPPQDQDQALRTDLPEISSSSSSSAYSFSDSDSAASPGPDSDVSMKDPSAEEQEEEEEEEEEDPPALAQDLLEALTYTATYDQAAATTRSRDAVRARLRAEHELWADAERSDARAAAREEARLWKVVYDGRGRVKEDQEEEEAEGEDDDDDDDKKGEGEGEMQRRSGLVDPGGANWREHIEYYSEWEVMGRRKGGGGGGVADGSYTNKE